MLQVVIPTHPPHFVYNVKFLEVFQKYCLDKESVTINFIISKDEVSYFHAIMASADFKLNIKIWNLKDLVKEIFNKDIDETQLLKQIGKYNFQCLKKFIGVYKFGNPYSLLIDAETLIIRNFKMQELFDNHFNRDKHIFYTRNDYGNFIGVQKQLTEDCLRILEEDTKLPFYFLEAYNWFFDKNIVQDLFNKIKEIHNCSIFEILTEKYKIIFETPLYNLFIYYNNDKYNYEFICINDELHKIMGEKEYEIYKSNKELPTVFEFHAKIMNTQYQVDIFKVFYNKYKLNFFKYGILQEKQFSPYQIKFIENTEAIIFLCTLWYVPEKELEELSKRIT